MTSEENLLPDTFGKAVGNLYLGGPANVSWERALGGLSEADARQRPPYLPHSVADIVGHVQFWQAYLLDVIDGVDRPTNLSAAEGWPTLGDSLEDWAQLQADFFRDSGRLGELARDAAFVQTPDRKGRPYGVALTNTAGHSVYHLGQVVCVRQALGLWPPLDGAGT